MLSLSLFARSSSAFCTTYSAPRVAAQLVSCEYYHTRPHSHTHTLTLTLLRCLERAISLPPLPASLQLWKSRGCEVAG